MGGRIIAAVLGGAIVLAGCATTRVGAPGSELVGRTVRMETARGEVTMLSFRGDGTVQAAFARGAITGRWQAGEGQLCFFWTGAPRECWPYRERFSRGRTVGLTSDRGNVLRVTLL